FYLASRRRHTIFSRDWSSDVCSSDLVRGGGPECDAGESWTEVCAGVGGGAGVVVVVVALGSRGLGDAAFECGGAVRAGRGGGLGGSGPAVPAAARGGGHLPLPAARSEE